MPDLPPPPMPAMCDMCGDPVTPFSVETAAHNNVSFDEEIAGEPTHIPTRNGGFYFMCGATRR